MLETDLGLACGKLFGLHVCLCVIFACVCGFCVHVSCATGEISCVYFSVLCPRFSVTGKISSFFCLGIIKVDLFLDIKVDLILDISYIPCHFSYGIYVYVFIYILYFICMN